MPISRATVIGSIALAIVITIIILVIMTEIQKRDELLKRCVHDFMRGFWRATPDSLQDNCQDAFVYIDDDDNDGSPTYVMRGMAVTVRDGEQPSSSHVRSVPREPEGIPDGIFHLRIDSHGAFGGATGADGLMEWSAHIIDEDVESEHVIVITIDFARGFMTWTRVDDAQHPVVWEKDANVSKIIVDP
jgi:hypothetical protein